MFEGLRLVSTEAAREALVQLMARAESAGLVQGRPSEMAAHFAALLWGDTLLELLLGVSEPPDARELARRARAATTAVLQLYPAEPPPSRLAHASLHASADRAARGVQHTHKLSQHIQSLHLELRIQDLRRALAWVLHGKVKPSPPTAPESADVHVLSQGAGYFFASHQNVLIASWTAQGTGPLVAELAKALGAFIAQHPSGVSNLHIIAEGLPLANAEARDALAALMTSHEGSIACVGTVLDGTGFWASATRGLIMSVQLMAPSSFPVRTCANDAELVGWLPKVHAQRTGITLDPQAMERAMAEVRSLSTGRAG